MANPMITDVDTCLKDIADWYIKTRREITEPELEAILLKHCEDEAEVRKFVKFLETEPGQLRFKTLLRERKEKGKSEFVPAFPGALFPLGQLVTTSGVSAKMQEDPEFEKFVRESIARHHSGDWGIMPEEDKKQNEYALGKYLRLFSAYEKPPLPKIWIITEADRSVTTTLFPSEY